MNEIIAYFIKILEAIGYTFVIWVLGYLLGHASKYIITNILGKLGVDEFVKRTGLGRAIRRTGLMGHEFFGILTAWIIYLLFAFLGLYIAGVKLEVKFIIDIAETVIYVYIAGGLKLLLIVLIGFTLIDVFVGYIYKSTELKAEMQILYPMAEYIRITLYIAVVTYAVEQSGLGVGVLPMLLMPLIWGITILIVLFTIYLILISIRTSRVTQ